MKKAFQASTNQWLINERRQHAWLQQDVADRVGTTRVTISRWEHRITLPSPYFRQQLCAVFEKSAAELGLLIDDADEMGEMEEISSYNQDKDCRCIYIIVIIQQC